MNRYSIAQTCIPSNRGGQGMINPRENSVTDWQFQPEREPGYSQAFMGANYQNDNMTSQREGHQSVKSGMFLRLTGEEPTYGHINYQLNPLDNNRNNLVVGAIQGSTQVQWSKDPTILMAKSPSQYPNYRGRQDYYNYPGSVYFRK